MIGWRGSQHDDLVFECHFTGPIREHGASLQMGGGNVNPGPNEEERTS